MYKLMRKENMKANMKYFLCANFSNFEKNFDLSRFILTYRFNENAIVPQLYNVLNDSPRNNTTIAL